MCSKKHTFKILPYLYTIKFKQSKKDIMKKREIKATANQSKKTFTIRISDETGIYAKYRTSPMSKPEFEEAQYNTQNDWEDFLKSGSYTKVK